MVSYYLKMSIKVPDKVDAVAVAILLFARRILYGYKFRRVPLTRGKYAIVDPEDYEWLMKYKWHTNCAKGKFYAVNSRSQKMHRLIMNAPKSKFIDHINGDRLDNRKANLRLVTPTQNVWNSKSGMDRGKSKYKGVKWHKHVKKWAAVISVNGQKRHLSYFTDEKAAAIAYDKAARELRGEFAVLNFPKGSMRIKEK